jgi:hypothetical protein
VRLPVGDEDRDLFAVRFDDGSSLGVEVGHRNP